MFKKLKSDYVSFFNEKTQNQPLPSGYPCTFDSDCQSPSICQFNVCTVNIGGNKTDELTNICKGMSIKDCAKEMQKERETTEIPIYIPNYPSVSLNSETGGINSVENSVNMSTYINKCQYDKECNKNEICLSGTCVDKSNFPLIAKQKRLKSSNFQNEINKQNIYTINNVSKEFDTKTYFQHKKTPLDGNLSAYEYMFLLEKNVNEVPNTILELHDDYFYF